MNGPAWRDDETVAVVAAGPVRYPLVAGATIRIGRDPVCDIVVNHPLASRRHAQISADHSGVVLVRDLGSANGSFVAGRRVSEFAVAEGSVLNLGAVDGPAVTITRSPVPSAMEKQPPGGARPDSLIPLTTVPAGADGPDRRTMRHGPLNPVTAVGTGAIGAVRDPAAGAGPGETVLVTADRVARGETITIGRAPSNTIVLDDPLVSRHHARLTGSPQEGYRVEDRSSLNGVQINGRPAPSGSIFRAGDLLGVGRTTLLISDGRIVTPEPAQTALIADELGFDIKSHGERKVLLDKVSFQVQVGALVAVIGPSGAGKSTLLRAITGSQPATSGSVIYRGADLYENFANLRQRIGVVPQDDVVHRRLTVRKALRYAAQLRLPADYDAQAREHEVDRVIGDLGLTEHADTLISRISGGQRKRVSVALELLTQPELLLLDEPTSGLDPGMDKSVMELLRAQADGGRAVLVVTHSTDNLALCDQVLILAPGGGVAYFGPPSEVLGYFGAARYAEVFQSLSDDPARHIGRYRQLHPSTPAPAPTSTPEMTSPPRLRRGRQWRTLISRQLAVIVSDRSYAVSTLLLPIIVGLMALAIPGEGGFGRPGPDNPGEPNQLLVIITVGAGFMGMAATIRELIGERAIFLRERAVGLSPVIYTGAKIFVLFMLTLIQSTLLVSVVRLGKSGPGDGIWADGTIELAIAAFGTAFASGMIGLLLSAVVTSSEQTMPALVIAVMAQLVLCGGLIEVTGRSVMEIVAAIAPSRWGYGQAAATMDLRRLNPQVADDPLWEHALGVWLHGLIGLVTISVVAGVLTLVRLTRQRSSV
ncbi:ATP-binding cassette domain-containing protein [Propionibacterium australiense]|uniref:AAA+ ATPase domain n=1 Tax=Propionibacterium australiense TaxID=119981 RepID=A0A383S8X2_9ACTN|nr:ATP-binding cassette domain-containing protein [Propionibacterium australiense]RLP09474.1 ATP-binding cassette domain-containing protein [Propionibacterium australiense]RLP09948.1 ATP-binding cassette domain-containing protein [Propionibacterium australiense]SYZ33864.1 AAA+ ATPase domain [Propionibacterium australiense]VEH92047.1 Arginine transport ATP-binding protein ArtM [Propionibacterium australiense]